MRKLFSSHKRFIGLGLMSALVIALAVLGALWGFSQSASAQTPIVSMLHVEPSGADYTGNPYCPDTDWTGLRRPAAKPWHDCNNITSQNHVIRTEGWSTNFTNPIWVLENFSGAVAASMEGGTAGGACGALSLIAGLTDADSPAPLTPDAWDEANNTERCLIIHSSTPGETRVTLSYTDTKGTTDPADDTIGHAVAYNSGSPPLPALVKEWDSLTDSVILKYGDGDLVKVKVYYDADGDTVIGSSESKDLYLPPDVNGDTVRDTDDEHLLDKQSKWQDHGVVWDEAVKRIRSLPPVEITEVVHGQHSVLINSVSIITHQPTEGALVLAVIESPRFCTFFTNSTGSANYGATVSGVSDNLGRLIFPAGGLGVYVDTVCEEQAVIHFYAQYPNLPGSLRLGLHEWIGINWTTIEQAKQPQIRWAGEEIVLAKRWALPTEWYPNLVPDTTTPQPSCPLASNFDVDGDGSWDMDDLEALGHVQGDTILDYDVAYYQLHPSPGVLEGAWGDDDGDGVLDDFDTANGGEVSGDIDLNCISKGLYGSEDPGQVDVEAKLMEEACVCEPDDDATDPVWMDLENNSVACWDDSDGGAPGNVECYDKLINKHAFLVWYLKIYQVKLTNVDGARENHNAGAWNQGEGEDTEADTLNVSADTLLRVKVKGWLYTANLSGHGAVCIDMDGDGNGLEGEEASEPGVPYPLTNEDVGCVDTGDEMLENGYWVLPDDLVALAGPDAINTRPNWDVMGEADAASTGAIGPKSALDSHDATLRAWVGRKSIAPDGAITAADAIMPPLKIRASIASGDAGYLKEALKAVVSTSDYQSIMIPADREIPAVVNNGGYDWMSWTMPACPDADQDGVCDAVDKCPADFDPTNNDVDSDGTGDVCDADADNDTDLNAADNCPLKANADQLDANTNGIGDVCEDAATHTLMDTDGDTVPDATDNCDTKANAPAQTDTDGDGFGDACDANPSVSYKAVAPKPYPFWTILYKLEREDLKETNPALKKAPYYIEFYTDNRGEGMFFANGDFNLSYDDCRTDSVSSGWDCSSGDVVGNSTISVIGDYPFFRKHPAVLSNPVEKTWTWGGDKSVTIQQLDPNHTRVIAHVTDRDGYCKWDAATTPTPVGMKVQFSPSLHPVEGEEITFDIVNGVGHILGDDQGGMSRNALFNLAPSPLVKTTVKDWEDGFLASSEKAVVKAEDVRLLGAIGLAATTDINEEECQAWVLIEHPLGAELEVSVSFDDPEGRVTRHWPPSELTVSLVQYWNDSCYAGPSQPIDEAMADIIDNVLAVYRYTAEQTWEAYFPGRCEEAEGLCTIETLEPYDQLFILMSASADWLQLLQAPPTSADLVTAWNSICYTGVDKATEEAVRDIDSAFAIMYQLGSDQAWRRYVPARPEIPDTLTTLHMFDSVVLLVTTEGGITWTFDP